MEDTYDAKTGTSATAFRDTDTGEVIIAYTGTNPNGEGLTGKLEYVKDILTDINDIGLTQGRHYQPAYQFYEKIADKYGADNITLTGHSLGGNIAQRVALKYNVPNTVVYNAAPLYIPAGVAASVTKGLKAVNPWEHVRSLYATATTVQQIEAERARFTGKVTRITTTKDFLNNISDKVGGVYLGQEYILNNSGGHNLDGIVKSKSQLEQLKGILEPVHSVKIHLKHVQNDLKKLQQRKKMLSTNNDKGQCAIGDLTASERIFLDSEQALIVSNGLSTYARAGLERIEAQVESAKSLASDLYRELGEVPWGFTLSSDELRSAYAASGLTYSTTYQELSEHCAAKKDKAVELVTSFESLQGDIEAKVSAAITQDAQLAALFAK